MLQFGQFAGLIEFWQKVIAVTALDPKVETNFICCILYIEKSTRGITDDPFPE